MRRSRADSGVLPILAAQPLQATKELSADFLAALSASFRIVRVLEFGETTPPFPAFRSSRLTIAPILSKEGAFA
jgi:hypothetical protein